MSKEKLKIPVGVVDVKAYKKMMKKGHLQDVYKQMQEDLLTEIETLAKKAYGTE